MKRWVASAFLSVIMAANSSACRDALSPASPSDPQTPPPPIAYTAIGASDAIGIGSSTGQGYVQRAVRELRDRGLTVGLTVLGVPTAVIGPDFQALGQRHGLFILGNFITHQAPFVPTDTTLVSIFAGPNDVNTITHALGKGEGAANPIAYIDDQVRAFEADYNTLLGVIRGRAPSARIVVLNLPNMAVMPYLLNATVPHRQAARLVSVGMTTRAINPLAARSSQQIAVVDMMCDSRSYESSTYSSDGFHPSDAGYAWIAAEVVRAVTTAYPAPRASCPAMSAGP